MSAKVSVLSNTFQNSISRGVTSRQFVSHTKDVLSVAFSADNRQIVSGSRDKTIKLWNTLAQCKYTVNVGVLNVGVREKLRKLQIEAVQYFMNVMFFLQSILCNVTNGRNILICHCMFFIAVIVILLFQEDCHTDWVSNVRFSPSSSNPVIVSAGWDKIVKVWNLANCKLKTNHIGHTGYINTVTVSPDGSLCASGGKVR